MRFNSWIFHLWPLSNYDAITLPWGVYFKNSYDQVSPSTIRHEMIHIEQKKKIGVVKFYTLYLWYYVNNLWKYKNHDMAYRNIPFEVEAYNNEGNSHGQNNT